jgi:hypothetical protein
VSNHLAIAAATATLRTILQMAADASGVSGALVTHIRPDAPAGLPPSGVNIYLYRISPNTSWRNADLPTRRPDGALLRRPQTALDLHYLLTFYGDDAHLEPQQLLGAVTSALHAEPTLPRATIRSTIATVHNGTDHFLETSGLADQPELVRLTPTDLSLEEMSKLWSVFFQTHYTLSAAYVATVVLIEADAPLPAPALPVLRPVVDVSAQPPPRIDAVELADPAYAAQLRLVLRGAYLNSVGTIVRFAAGDGTILPGSTDDTLLVDAPPGLRAGVTAVTVVRPSPTLGPPHLAAASDPVPLVVRPRLITATSATGSGRLLLADVAPAVAAAQAVALLLTSTGAGPPQSFELPALRRTQDADPLLFPADAVPDGTYLARVRVDGVESVPTGPGPFTGPTVSLP